MRFILSDSISSDFNGYETLIDLFNRTHKLRFEDIILDFSKTKWFEANLTAVLGGILNKAQEGFNNIELEGLSNDINNLLSRNLFLSNFGGSRIPDFYDTTIEYHKFKIVEEKLFKEYLDKELISKKVMPKMSDLLKKKVNESLIEIFNNAVIHGNCKKIFTCGQYYPAKNRLDFTIVNLGKTIKENVNEYLNKTLSGDEAIKWAVIEGNTTKRGPIPGGLGLSLIREFISKNEGKIQIVSADGYWEQIKDTGKSECFSQAFFGTIVNLEFNTADTSSYCLASEIDEEDIF